MNVAANRRSLTVNGLWEALAFVSPIVLFGFGATSRVLAFLDTHSAVTALNAAGFVALTSVFVIRRRAQEVDRSFRSLFVALCGNFLPFMFILHDSVDVAAPLPLIIQMVSVALGIWTVMSLRSSMGVTPANRGIKTGGPYRFVRHPLYVCVILSQVGLLMVYPHPVNAGVLVMAIIFKSWMVVNEERILRQDPSYREYMERVRYRAIPGVI